MATQLLNFDDAFAPEAFSQQTELTTQYSDQGVRFAGQSGAGWEVLNDSGNFGIGGYSAPNFLAWNTELTSAAEILSFAAPASDVSLQVGSTEAGTFTATAFDDQGNELGSSTIALTSALQSIALPYSAIATVQFSTTAWFGVLDNLQFEIEDFTPPTPVTATIDTAGNLVIADSDSDPNNNQLRISSDGSYLIFSDPLVAFAAAPSAGSIVSDGGRTLAIPLADVTGTITFLAGGGDDTFVVDYSTSITNVINFEGGVGGYDTLSIQAYADTIYTPSATVYGDGVVEHGGSVINFVGLEPVDFDFFGPGTFTLALPGVNDTVGIANGTTVMGALPALIISGSSGGTPFETAHVRNATNIVIDTITNGTTGVDAVTIASADNAHGNTNLTISTETLNVSGATVFSGALNFTAANVSSTAAGTISTGNGLTVNTSGTTSTLTGNISGAGGVVKTGTGTLTLAGNNAYTGGTVLSQGTLVHGSANATGAATAPITINDALTGANATTLRFTTGVINSGTATTYKPITVNNFGTTTTLDFNQGAAFVNANVAISKAITISTTVGGNQFGLMGTISGTGAGAGNTSVTFANAAGANFYYTAGYTGSGIAANTFAGNATIAGNINLQNLTYINAAYVNGVFPDTSNVTINAGATWTQVWGAESINGLDGGGNLNNNGLAITVGTSNGGGSYSGIVTGGGSLTKAGNGTQTFSGANSYSGGTFVNLGILRLDLTARSNNNPLNLGTLTVNTPGTLELFTNGTASFGTTALFSTGTTMLGTGTITKTGTGYVDFWNGTNIKDFAGLIDVQAGLLSNQTNGAGAWSTSAGNMSLNVAAGAFFDLRTDGGIVIDRLTGSGTIGGSFTAGMSITVGAQGGSSTFSGVIQNTVPGFANVPTIALNKVGLGTFTLSGANSYTGGTTVTAGTLQLNLVSRSGAVNLGEISVGVNGTLDFFNTNNGVDNVLVTGTTHIFGSGKVTKTGAGYVGLWNDTDTIKDFTGLVDIQAGTLGSNGNGWQNSAGLMDLNIAAGAAFDIRTQNVLVNRLTGTGSIGSSHNAAVQLLVGNNNSDFAFGGIIHNGGDPAWSGGVNAGVVSLHKVGTGTLTLSGASTYTGGTTISGGGVLSVGAIADSGTSNIGFTGGVTFGTGGGTLRYTGATGSTNRAFAFTGAGTFDVTASNALSLTGGGWSGGGGVTKIGTGTLTVGNNRGGDRFNIGSDNGGNFTMSAGTLNISPSLYFTMGDNGASSSFNQTGGTTNYTASSGAYIGNGPSGTATLNLNGGTFNHTGGFEFRIGANGSSGVVNINGGTLSANAVILVGYSGAGTGTINLTSGNLNQTAGGNFFIGNNGSSGTVTVNGGTLTTNAAMWVGFSGAGTGTLNLSSGTVNQSGIYFVVGNSSTGSLFNQTGGTYNFTGANGVYIGNGGTGTATMTLSGGTFNQTAGFDFRVGANGASGVVNVDGGSLFTNAAMWIGYSSSGTGTFNLSSGSVAQSGQFFVVGNTATSSVYNQTGGTYNYTGANGTYIGNGPSGGTGTMTVSGGSFTQTNDVMRVGQNSTSVGNLNIGGGAGLASVTAPTVTFAANSATAPGTLNLLTNGTLTTSAINVGAAGRPGTFNFDGGTLRARSSTTTWMQGLTAANVRAGGATIDTNSFNVTIAQNLLPGTPSGGLTKIGAGTLTLTGGNTYSGNTTVSAGTLDIAGTGFLYNALPSTATVSVSSGATITISTSSFNALGYGAGESWIVAGTINVTGGGPNTLPGTVILNGGTLTSSSVNATFGSYYANAATITANGTGNIISGDFGIQSGTSLTLSTPLAGDALSVSSPLRSVNGGTGGLTKTGLGTVTLSGGNTYGGNTSVTAGTLNIAGTGFLYNALPSAATVSVSSNATITLSTSSFNALGYGASESWIVAGTINVTGGGPNTLPGTVTLNGGTLTSTSTQATFGAYFANGATITANGTGNTISSVDFGIASGTALNLVTPLIGDTLSVSTGFKNVSGAGGLTKSGLGTATLTSSSVSSYTGATTVSGGTLVVNGSIATSSLTTVNSGATLAGTGTTGPLTVQSGGNLSPGNSPGVINTGNLALGGNFNVELNNGAAGQVNAGVTYDQTNVTGTVNVAGGILVLSGDRTISTNGDAFVLIKNDGTDAVTGMGTFTTDVNGNSVALTEGAVLQFGGVIYTITYVYNAEAGTLTGGNDVALIDAASLSLFWDADGNTTAGTGGTGTWDTTSATWRAGSVTGPLVIWNNANNDDAVFPATAGTVSIQAAGITAKSVSFQVTGYNVQNNTLTLAAGTGIIDVVAAGTASISSVIAGSTGLTKNNTGTLALTNSAANTYTGGTFVNGGILSLGTGGTAVNTSNAAALGAGPVTVNTGAQVRLWIKNDAAFTLANNFVLNGGTIHAEDGNYNLTGTVTLNGGGTLSARYGAKDLKVSGLISGSGLLTVQNINGNSGGAVIFANTAANTYTDGTAVTNSLLILGTGGTAANTSNAAAMGTGTVTVNAGGQVRLWIKNDAAFTIANPFTLNGGTVHNEDGNYTLSGAIALTATSTLSAKWGAKDLNVSGKITGAGGLTIQNVNANNGGAVVLSNNTNDYSGTTTITNNLRLGASQVIPDGAGKGNVSLAGSLNLNGNSETINGLTGTGTVTTGVVGTSTFTVGANDQTSAFAGLIQNGTGTVALTKTGTGTLTLNSLAANTYSGGTIVNGGVLSLGTGGTAADTSHVAALGIGLVTVNAGGQLRLWIRNNAAFTIANNFSLNGGSIHDEDGNYTLSGTVSVLSNSTLSARYAAKDLAIGGVISGAGGLTIQNVNGNSGGAVVFNNTGNSYAGNTTITHNLRLGNSNVIPDGVAAGNVSVAGTLNLNGNSETINGLSGAGIVTSGLAGAVTFTAGGNNQTSTFTGTIQNGTGVVSVVKTGTGMLTLNGANTFSGGLSVDLGTLQVLGNQTNNRLLANSQVTINNGGTFEYGQVNAAPAVDYTVNAGGTLRFVNAVGGAGFHAHVRNLNLNGGTVVDALTANGYNGEAFQLDGDITVGGSVPSTMNLQSGALGGMSLDGNRLFTIADVTGDANADLIINGEIENRDNNLSALTKAGLGTLRLNGINTYTGTTTVNAGTLQLQNGQAIADNAGAVTVDLGATLQLLNDETISAYVGLGDNVGTNDSLLALGANTLTTTGSAAIANVTTTTGGAIIAGDAILDNDDDNNITGTNIYLRAVNGIGTASDPIETAVAAIQVYNTTSGVVNVVNSNAGALLTVSDLGGLGSAGFGARNLGGALTITNSSPLTIAAPVIAAGTVTLTASDSATNDVDHLIVAATVESTTADVFLNAGDDATINAAVTAATNVTINVDYLTADTLGSTATINAAITTPLGNYTFLNGNIEADTFELAPQSTTEFRIFGDDPTDAPGDVLTKNVTGLGATLSAPGSVFTGAGSGDWTFAGGLLPVRFGSIENLDITGNYHLGYNNDATKAGNLVLMLDASGDNFELRNGSTAGALLLSGSLATVLSLTVNGNTDNVAEQLTIDDVNGLPMFSSSPVGGPDNLNVAGTASVLFNGNAGTNTLSFNLVQAGTSQLVGLGDGLAGADSSAEVLTTNNLPESLSVYGTSLSAISRTDSGAAPGALTLLAEGGDDVVDIAGNVANTDITTTGYATFSFSGNNYSALNIFGGLGEDELTLTSYGSGQTDSLATTLDGDTANDTGVATDGDSSADTLRVISTSGNTGTVTLRGGAGNDQFFLGDSTVNSMLNGIVGPVIVAGEAGTDTLNVDDQGSIGDKVIVVTETTIDGITVATGTEVSYTTIEVLNLLGGTGNDTITANMDGAATDLVTASLNGGGGDDTLLLSGVANLSNLYLLGGAGNDSLGTAADPIIPTATTQVILSGEAGTTAASNTTTPLNPTSPADGTTDEIFIDISSFTTAEVVDTGSGQVISIGTMPGHAPLYFNGMEEINLYDGNVLTNVGLGDLYLRSTDDGTADNILFYRGYTSASDVLVRMNNRMVSNTPFRPTTRVVAYGRGGGDSIQLNYTAGTIAAEFHGEDGNDKLLGSFQNDLLVGGAHNDHLIGMDGNDILWGDQQALTWAGRSGDNSPGSTDGDDILEGTAGDDFIFGGSGNDLLNGMSGSDYLHGGFGNDNLVGGDGNDFLRAGDGNDTLVGDAGDDIAIAGAGNDFIYGSAGRDFHLAGADSDRIYDLNDNGEDISVTEALTYDADLANPAYNPNNPLTFFGPNDVALLALMTSWTNPVDSFATRAAAASAILLPLATNDGAIDYMYGNTLAQDYSIVVTGAIYANRTGDAVDELV